MDPPSGNSLGVGAESPNDRTFALAGCAAFQLVDRTRPGLWDCFTDGVEMVGFSDPEDLAEKIQGVPGQTGNQGEDWRSGTTKGLPAAHLQAPVGGDLPENPPLPGEELGDHDQTSPPQVFTFPPAFFPPGQGLLYKTRGARDR